MIEHMSLPKGRDLALMIDRHCTRELSRLAPLRTMWLLAYHYVCCGARRFDVCDPETGRVLPFWVDKNGDFEFQSNQLTSIIDKVVGQLSGLDLRPSVGRIGSSRTGMKERAVAQLLCDAAVSDDVLDEFKLRALPTFVMLGGIGIHSHVVGHNTIGLGADFEAVHPNQIFPFPSLGQNTMGDRGIIRERSVPIEYLYERFGKRKINDHIDQGPESLETWSQDYGEIPPTTSVGDGLAATNFLSAGYSGISGAPSSTDNCARLCRIRELWMKGPIGTCERYVVCSGSYVLEDTDLRGTETYCPLNYARFMENGSFHGCGVFQLLFSASRQHELMMKALVNNMMTLDKYGVLVVPHGQFNERAMFKDVGNGLRIFPWEPDPISESFNPFVIAPHNAGDAPGKTAAYLANFIEQQNPVRDLLREKGRVDSANGLQFLDEIANQSLTTCTANLVRAMGNSYRSTCQQVASDLLKEPRPIPLARLTIDLAGVIIDPKKNEAVFPSNPLPNVSRLSFSIRESKPKSELARKQEALDLHLKGLIDSPDRLWLLAMKEGLDFANWLDDYSAAYETVVRDVLTLYNDGQTPGELIVTQYTVKPDFQLVVLSAFLASLAMRVASPDVQDAFQHYRDTLIQWAGLALPKAVPNPDDAALMTPQMPSGAGVPQ